MKTLFFLSFILFNIFFITEKTHAVFSSEDEFSLIQTGGKTDTKSLRFDTRNNYIPEFLNKKEFNINYSYIISRSGNTTFKETWNLRLSHEQAIAIKTSFIIAEEIESNRFLDLRRRYNSDIGIKYTFSKKKKRTFFTEVGYRYADETNVKTSQESIVTSNIRIYSRLKQELNEQASFGMIFEHIQNLDDSDDYRVQLKPSLSVVMTDKLSLKIAYQWDFDNTPLNGNPSTDYILTTGVLANF